MRNLPVAAILVALLVFMVVFDYLSVRHNSLTYDEPIHFRYGSNILNHNSSRFIDGTMPFTALNAMLQRLGRLLHVDLRNNVLMKVETGRIVTILFSALLGYFIFIWARSLYGVRAGLLSLFIYVFSPNVIAHASLITTDVYAAGMVAISTYCFWRFLNSGGWKLATLSAVTLGLAQLAKYSCMFLYPIFVMILIARCGVDLGRAGKLRAWGRLGLQLAGFLKFALFFAVVSVAIINAGFLFNKTMMPLEQYEMKSVAFKSMQARLGALAAVPVPLPEPYLQGLDWGRYREETGKGFGSMYLFGRLREIGGFTAYYLIAFLFKEPLAIQALIVLAIVLYARRPRRYSFMRNELFLTVPVIFYVIYMNFFFKMQIGIRHYLVIYPFLYVFCGSLVADRGEMESVPCEPRRPGRKLGIAIMALLGYLVVSVFSYFPHYIPYFNELVWDRKGYKILADSNIDWGQGFSYAKAYVVEHPGTFLEQGLWHMKSYREKHMEEYLHPQFPDSGMILVNVNNYVGIYHPTRYEWLRKSYKPVGQVAYAYLLFRLQPGDSTKASPAQIKEPAADSLELDDGAR